MGKKDNAAAASGLRVGITVGDPAGVGPEITVKALEAFPADLGAPVVYGHRDFLVPGNPSAPPAGAGRGIDWSKVAIVEPERIEAPVPRGRSSAEGGRLSLAWVERAARDALDGRIDAVVTGPVSKESWALAGSPYLSTPGCGFPWSPITSACAMFRTPSSPP
jgi:4-hydroxythreonine-4-phosphate dehydrogenase